MARRAKPPQVKETTVRDFSGGLNVIDNELNLDPRFCVQLDNMSRAPDGSLTPRYGKRLFCNLRTGTTGSVGPVNVTVATNVGSTLITITHNAHGRASGDHVQFSDLASASGIPVEEMNAKHGIVVLDANRFTFHVRTNAAAITSTVQNNKNYTWDKHILSGDTIEGVYFQDYLIVFDNIGEIAQINSAGVATRIWSHQQAAALPGAPAPWRDCTFVTFDTSKSKLIAANTEDKPLEIDTSISPAVQFYLDPATSSNAFVPTARLVKVVNQYVVMTEATAPAIARIGARNAAGVFTGNPSPDDAVDVDVTQVTSVVNPRIIALNLYRDKLYVAFQNSAVLADLGIYNGDIHDPQFADTLSAHGTVSHRSCVALGSDLFSLDYSGIPSITTSIQSGQYMPDRVSDLIEPLIQRHLARLSDTTLEEKTFAIWNPRQRQYMVFVPKFDDNDTRNLPDDPLISTSTLVGSPLLFMNIPNHALEEGDYIEISGVSGTVGGVPDTAINGTRRISAVIGEDYVLIEVAANVITGGQQLGGTSVTISPVNDETITYVYTYYPKLKVRAWSRYRGWRISWAATSLFGRVFLGYQGKVYLYGADSDPFYADDVDDYDTIWANNTAYTVGHRTLDTASGVVYVCATNHTSAAVGTFAADRAARTALWDQWIGTAINWAAELPWADFNRRWPVKSIRQMQLDAKGTARFTVELFVDNIYRDQQTFARSPARSMTFVGGDAGGFGAGPQPFGGGRRTREQLLWGMPVRAKLLKVRFSGQTTEALRLVGVSFTYHEGTVHR